MKQTANVDKIKRESFKAPIPGISLTETPGKFPWDKPPRMTNPQEVLEYVEKILLQPETTEKIVDLLEAKASPKLLAKSVSKGGWFGNLWNPDIGELIELPVAAMITLIGLEAEVDMNFGSDKKNMKPLLAQAKRRLKEIEKEKKNTIEGDVEEAVIVEDEPVIGIMSRSL